MIAAAARTVGIIALAAVAFVYVFERGGTHRVLDPNDPIAADGSLIAGRAHTIFDTNPAYGAFRPPADASALAWMTTSCTGMSLAAVAGAAAPWAWVWPAASRTTAADNALRRK